MKRWGTLVQVTYNETDVNWTFSGFDPWKPTWNSVLQGYEKQHDDQSNEYPENGENLGDPVLYSVSKEGIYQFCQWKLRNFGSQYSASIYRRMESIWSLPVWDVRGGRISRAALHFIQGAFPDSFSIFFTIVACQHFCSLLKVCS